MTLAAKLLLFLLLPTVLWLTEHVDCQSNSSLVFKPTGLSQALAMSSLATIAVSGTNLFCSGFVPFVVEVVPTCGIMQAISPLLLLHGRLRV